MCYVESKEDLGRKILKYRLLYLRNIRFYKASESNSFFAGTVISVSKYKMGKYGIYFLEWAISRFFGTKEKF